MLYHALGPAAATVSAALVSLGGCDADAVAAAIHWGTCWDCLIGELCDAGPSDDDRAFAHAFTSTLEILAVQAEPSTRAHADNSD